MAQKLSEQVASLLRPFAASLGEHMDRVVNDMSAFLGRQAITVKEGEWKAGAKLSLAAKDMSKMSLPPNNPLSHLLWFSIRIRELETISKMEITATLPEVCQAWFTQLVAKEVHAD